MPNDQSNNAQATINVDQQLVLKSITSLENLLKAKKGFLRRSLDLVENEIKKNEMTTDYYLAFSNAYNAYEKIVDD
ncbi:MAG: hypothetical protein QXD43_05500, partial [Candidatus Aenigmatarchaeota archaeon]